MALPVLQKEINMAAAARLYAENTDQQKIAKRLNMSQASVSRLIKSAIEEGWLVRQVTYNSEKIPPEVRKHAEERVLSKDILRVSEEMTRNTRLSKVQIVETSVEASNARERHESFANAIAQDVFKLLAGDDNDIQIAGISWGKTLHHVVSAIPSVASAAPRIKNPITFIPLCGEPLGYVPEAASSSDLVAKMNECINSGLGARYTLNGVGAFIPPDFSPQEQTVVDKLNRRIHSYEQIFPPRFPSGRKSKSKAADDYLVNKMDLVLTSVGRPEDALSFSHAEWSEHVAINPELLEKYVIGDIGGLWIARKPLKSGGKKLLDSWQSAWTGVKKEHLTNENGRKRPHVVVMAWGEKKAEIVWQVVQENLVDELYIDVELATAIKSNHLDSNDS